jgi:hypothetical protein
MMFLNSRTGIILKAGTVALLWISIITYTTFPGLVGDTVSFLSEQISFENTGKFLLFQIGIYLFDLLVQISYSVDKHVKKYTLMVGAITSAIICVFLVPYSIDRETPRIIPILIIAIQMGLLKSFNLYHGNNISNDKPLKLI